MTRRRKINSSSGREIAMRKKNKRLDKAKTNRSHWNASIDK
jgi:hypothetical protein